MRIAILTDAHANVLALQAVLNALEAHQPDRLIHLGDAISIGPYPAETLDLLLNTPDMHYIMGNHDWWWVNGLPQPQPDWMSDGEVAHQQWTHAQLNPAWRMQMAQWPFVQLETFEGVRVAFLHYALQGAGPDFADFVRDATAADYDRMFAPYAVDVVCFGHTHQFTDLTGQARYINPGALGCSADDQARFTLLDCTNGRCEVAHHRVPYDRPRVLRAFELRQVPERDFIQRAFFGHSPDAGDES